MATAYSVLDSRDKNELNQTITNTKNELQGNIDTLENKHDDEVAELQGQIDALESEKATKAELSSHNTSNSAHNDIRLLIQNLTTRLNTLADSDDTTLDQMSEIVAYIEANRDLIESITTSKVSVSDIVNNLTTNVTNKPLSASMGVTLKALIDAIPDNTLDIVNEKIQEHNVAADAHGDIRTDVLTAQSTASAAQAAADNAQSSADAAQADVDDALSRLNSLEVSSGKLDREVSTTDGIVTCEDALVDSGLIETKFYGKTVQNLWVNPNGTNNGLTATDNSDGSVSFSGTVTKDSSFSIYSNTIYTLKPNAKYVFFIDKVITQSFYSGNFTLYVSQFDSDGASTTGGVNSHIGGDSSRLSIVITIKPDTAYAVIGCFASSAKVGDTVSGTYRVMLREATEAEIAAAASTPQTLPVYPDDSGPDASNDELGIMPLNDVSTLSDTFDDYWCPPGLSSIDNVEIVTAGKNLVPKFNIANADNTRKLQCTINKDGSVHVKGIIDVGYQYVTDKFIIDNLVDGETYTIYDGDRSDRSIYCQIDRALKSDPNSHTYYSCSRGKYTFTVNKSLYNYMFNIQSGDSSNIGKNVDIVLYPQIEAGSEATDYEQPLVEKIPIDLDGYSLCSIPDDTQDELRIDKEGNVTLIKRIGVTLATDDNMVANGSGDVNSIAIGAANGNTATNKLTVPNDRVITGVAGWDYSKTWCVTGNSNSSVFAFILNKKTAEIINILNGGEFHYELINPKTIYLGKIDPPRLPSSTSHVWINGTANTTNFTLPVNDLSVRYWLPNGELVADIYDGGATEELSDTEIISIWNGATGDIVEASNVDIKAIFDDE